MNASRTAASLAVLGALIASCAAPTTSPASIQASVSANPSVARSWQEVGSFGADGGWDRAFRIARGEAGFMAIGERLEPGIEVGFAHGADYIWTSEDGQEWQSLPLPEQLGDAWLADVVPAPDGGFILYANAIGGPNPQRPRVLATSEEAESGWVEVDSHLPDDLGFFLKVVHGSAGYLMAGNSTPTRAAGLWFSEDGLTWDETYRFDESNGSIGIDDVGAGDDGFVVIGSLTSFEFTEWQRFSMASGDGRDWFTTEEPFGEEDPMYRPTMYVAPIGPDWIATVSTLDDAANFWRSANGLQWSRAGQITDLNTRERWAPALFPILGGLYFSLDANDIPDDSTFQVGFTSTDGAEWQPLAFDEEAILRAGLSGPWGTVLVGSKNEGEHEERATFWYLPPD